MKLVSINIRELGDVKCKYLKELIGKENPGVVFVQETKLDTQRSATVFG